MTRRRAPTYTRAQVMALAGAQAITAEAQARGDALMRGEKIPITVELEPAPDFESFLTAAAAASPEIAKAARAGKTRTTAPGASEAQVLSAVLAFLRRHPSVGWVKRMNVGAMENANGQHVKFGFVGLSDVIGQMKDGRWVAIECKREKGGRVEPEQAEFIERVRRFGGLAGVARSVDDARGILEGRA